MLDVGNTMFASILFKGLLRRLDTFGADGRSGKSIWKHDFTNIPYWYRGVERFSLIFMLGFES